MTTPLKETVGFYAGKNVLVTGGMGFIGSNLAIQLVHLGANVTIVDSMIDEYGGNLFNVESISERVKVNFSDICDVNAMNYLVRKQDVVFHLASQVSHVLSLSNPYPDIEYSIRGTVVLLEAIRLHGRRPRVVYSGTRGQYGASVRQPVPEDAPSNPKGIYEISKLAAEKIIQVYGVAHGIPSVCLRLTNIYGPRAQMKHSRFGVVNWFIRLAIEGKSIQVFGDGSIKRDFLYVDDCVEALLLAGVTEEAVGGLFNVGVDSPTTILEVVRKIIEAAGSGGWEFAPFSPERAAQEPGDYYSDITKIKRVMGWSPNTRLEDGLRQTVDFYRNHASQYWSRDGSGR